jgi:hypothetical protein
VLSKWQLVDEAQMPRVFREQLTTRRYASCALHAQTTREVEKCSIGGQALGRNASRQPFTF